MMRPTQCCQLLLISLLALYGLLNPRFAQYSNPFSTTTAKHAIVTRENVDSSSFQYNAGINATLLQMEKEDWCSLDFRNSKKALSLIQVAPRNETKHQQRILCMVTTISSNHATKCQAIKDTWGSQCDKLIFISNETDDSLGSVLIPLSAYDHAHLWEKTRKGIAFVWKSFRDEFDWLYKVDDDGFVIVDNLHAYLASSEIVEAQDKVPMQLGHNFRLPAGRARVGPEESREEYKKRFGSSLDYNSGGSGYVMNKLYVERFVKAMDKETCLPKKEQMKAAEDVAIAFCMKWEGAVVVDTRDLLRRPRFHWNAPGGTYHVTHSENDEKQDWWVVIWHREIGGYKGGEECCSGGSVAFHYVGPVLQYYLAAQLYYCRNHNVLTLDDFNRKQAMKIPLEIESKVRKAR